MHKSIIMNCYIPRYREWWLMHVLASTHWGRVTHICVSELTIIGSDNGLSPGRHRAIIWTNAGILLIGPYGTNFIQISIEILTFSFTKMSLKVSSAKWRPFCLGLNVLSAIAALFYPNWYLISSFSGVFTILVYPCFNNLELGGQFCRPSH